MDEISHPYNPSAMEKPGFFTTDDSIINGSDDLRAFPINLSGFLAEGNSHVTTTQNSHIPAALPPN